MTIMERRLNLLSQLRKPAALPSTYVPKNNTFISRSTSHHPSSQVLLPSLVPQPNPSAPVADPNPSSPRVSLPSLVPPPNTSAPVADPNPSAPRISLPRLVPPPNPSVTVTDPNPSAPRVSLPRLVPPPPNPLETATDQNPSSPRPSPRSLTLLRSPSPPLRPRSIPLEEPLPDLHPFGSQDFDLASYFRAQQGSVHRLMFVVEKRGPEPIRIAYQQRPNQQHDELADLMVPSPIRWGGQLVLTEPHTETKPPTISIWPISSTYRQLIPHEHLPELLEKVETDLRLRALSQRGNLKVIPPTPINILPALPFNPKAFRLYTKILNQLLTEHYPPQ